MPGLLDGIQVLECADVLAGPIGTCILRDMGAEVIKIERPISGDTARGMSALWGASMSLPGGSNVPFEMANRGKKSVSLNLSHELGQKILFRLAEKSDVFATNYRASVIKKLGLTYETLSRLNQGLIYASCNGYGSKGPFSERRSFDSIAQAMTGMNFSVGEREYPQPFRIAGGVMDTMTGVVFAMGILGALVARERSGIGQEVETSMLGTGIYMQSLGAQAALWRGYPHLRHSRKESRNPLANMYCCADGKWISLSELHSDRFWTPFCRAVDIPDDIANDPRFGTHEARRENFREMNLLLERTFLTKNRDEWIAILTEQVHDMAFAPVLELKEALEHPCCTENDCVIDYDHPVLGHTKLLAIPVKFSESDVGPKGPAPELGQHTEEVLIDLGGYTWDDIQMFREEGVI